MDTGIVLSWFGLIFSIFVFFGFVELCWQGFLWAFKIADDYFQERHWRNLHNKKINADDLLKMFAESEEMAA